MQAGEPLFPDEFATLIPGTELTIKAGCPDPRTMGETEIEEDLTVIVADVGGNSFLTTEGLGFGACFAYGYVVPTGVHHDEIKLSPEAQAILAQK